MRNRHRAMWIAFVCLTLATAFIARTSFSNDKMPPRDGDPQPFEFEASLVIKIEEGGLQKHGLSIRDFNLQTDKLLERSSFDLQELRELEIPSRDGGKVRLREIADLEVKLRRRDSEGEKKPAQAPKKPRTESE
jgi:hypothetical protein